MGTKKVAVAAKRDRAAKTLVGNGDGNLLTIIAGQLSNGRSRSLVIHRVGEKRLRSMIEFHDTYSAALERANKLVAVSLEKGWRERVKATKAPAFTEIPEPSSVPVAKAAKTPTPAPKPVAKIAPIATKKHANA